MNITMISIGSTGDVVPYISLGKELQNRGHRIILAAFSKFSGPVADSGLTFFPLSGNVEKMMISIMKSDHTGLGYLPRLEKSLHDVFDQLIRDITESCNEADALICNYFGTVYYSVAEMYQIPCIQTHFFPMDPTASFPVSSFPYHNLGGTVNRMSYRIAYLLIGLLERKYLNPWRKKHSLTVRKVRNRPDYHVCNQLIPVIYAVSPSLLPRPAEWPSNISMSGFWINEIDRTWIADDSLNTFLSHGDTPLYIGFGSMNAKHFEHLLGEILFVLRKIGLRAVINLGWTDRQYSSTNQVYFTEYIPHDWIFRRVCAVVHHGGAGTTAAGLYFGKPTLIIPFGGDQQFWGYQVFKQGCGPKPVPVKKANRKRLYSAFNDLVHSSAYTENTARISRELRQEHGIAVAADIIEKELRDRSSLSDE